MQPPRQQSQNWMRQWQDHLHKEQMASWFEQKKRKPASKAQATRQKQRFRSAEAEFDDRFERVESTVEKLRQYLAAGSLAPSQFNEKLKELMVEDAEGNWWMVGAASGEWYRHEDGNWVRAEPPGRSIRRGAAFSPAAGDAQVIESRPRWLAGTLVLLFGSFVTFVAGGFAIDLTEHGSSGDISLPLGLGIWFVGGVLTLIVARRVWRRD